MYETVHVREQDARAVTPTITHVGQENHPTPTQSGRKAKSRYMDWALEQASMSPNWTPEAMRKPLAASSTQPASGTQGTREMAFVPCPISVNPEIEIANPKLSSCRFFLGLTRPCAFLRISLSYLSIS